MKNIGLTQRVAHLEDRSERRDCLDQQWTRLLLGLSLRPVPLPNLVDDVTDYVESLALEGVILTGGNDLADLPQAVDPAPERDAFERKILAASMDLGMPVLGVCRGLQVAVRQSGGELVRIEGHDGTVHAIKASETSGAGLFSRDEVNSYHRFAIPRDGVGPDFQLDAVSADGYVEAVSHRHAPISGIMWHPERGPRDPRDADLITRFFQIGRR